MVGSGPALYRLKPGAKEAEKLTGTLEGGTVSGNLVVRFKGPNDLLASGHPQEGDAAGEPRADPLRPTTARPGHASRARRPTTTSSRSPAS